ncbi:FHA domain-containing protein [Marinicrinis lubricantis]|uniref:FHA domain-containing protein n=1 Tax=Marinicrinis lubricantis TaxID=2086470 RepID=A0ABW1IND7_9BACL
MKATTGFYWIKGIEILMAIIAIAATVFVYVINEEVVLKNVFGVFLALSAAWYVSVYLWPKAVKSRTKVSSISKLVLVDEAEHVMKEWQIEDQTSLLIGKSPITDEIDINLIDAEYASLVSRQHAVLNLVDGYWYVEDIQSKNGVGIKKAGQQARRKLEIETPHRVEPGDVIYIANTKLLVL